MTNEIKYDILRPWLTLDPWQKDFIAEKGNCFLLCGRQVGKSAACAIKCGELAVNNKNYVILMVAITEKQAYNLFVKALQYCEEVYPKKILRGLDKPTQHRIKFTNGSMIMCYAAGSEGEGLRGYTLNRLIVDEAAGMSKHFFTALTPALSVTGGHMDLLSTPRGKEGYFYEASTREDFTKFYVSAEDCPRHTKEFLDNEKKHMSALEYAQEYLAIFLDQLKRLFKDDIIKQCCTLKRRPYVLQGRKYFCGVDCARLGEDENTFCVLHKINKDYIEQVESIATRRQLTTETADKILELETKYKFRAIGTDSAGVGAGIYDILLRESKTRNKIEAIENASKPLDNKEEKSKHRKILKEDLYMNLLSLMEKNKIKLLDDDEIIASLKSIQYEYVITEGGKSYFRIFGNYSHLTEAIIRAAFLCTQDKSLELWCA